MAVEVQILWWGCSTTAWRWALKPSAGSSSTWSRPPLGCRCSSRSVSTAAPTWSQTCTHAEAPKNRFLQESLGQPAKIEQGWSKFLCTANPSYHNYYPYLSSAVDSRIPKTKQALCQRLWFFSNVLPKQPKIAKKDWAYGFSSVLAFFDTRFHWTSSWTAKLKRNLLALCFRRVLFDCLLLQGAPLKRPVWAFLLSCVALCHLGINIIN